MNSIKTKQIAKSLFVGFFWTCAVQLQAAAPQARPIGSSEGQRQPLKAAPATQPKAAPAPQQTRPQPQPQPRTSPTPQPRPVPYRPQNAPVAPSPYQNTNNQFGQTPVRHGQPSAQFQQANQFNNPTNQAENAGAPNATARFFVKWGTWYVVSAIAFLGLNTTDSSPSPWYLVLGGTAIFELIVMLLYYMGEGMNYLIFGPSGPAQATQQPAPMPQQVPMGR